MSPVDTGLAFFVADFWANGQTLFERLVKEVSWSSQIRARKVASFGVPYNYSGIVWPEQPMHEALVPIVEKLELRLGYAPNNCLLNYYPDGDSTMGYHFDSVGELEPETGISIVSLGSTRTISFRKEPDRKEVHELPLTSGSLLHMGGPMQSSWMHAIRKSENVSERRISLTFRKIIPQPLTKID